MRSKQDELATMNHNIDYTKPPLYIRTILK